MHKVLIPALAGASLLLLGGCVSSVGSIVTAPVKAASKAVDWTTTSQSESDRNYGRKKRKEEAREGRDERARDKACKADRRKCDDRDR